MAFQEEKGIAEGARWLWYAFPNIIFSISWFWKTFFYSL